MEFSEVVAAANRLGPLVHLATITPRGEPHVVPVSGAWFERHWYAAIGVGDAKTRNIRENPSVCMHHQVSEESGWDSLLVWGRGEILTSFMGMDSTVRTNRSPW